MQSIFLGLLQVTMQGMSLFTFQLWQLEDLMEHLVIRPTFFQKQSNNHLMRKPFP